MIPVTLGEPFGAMRSYSVASPTKALPTEVSPSRYYDSAYNSMLKNAKYTEYSIFSEERILCNRMERANHQHSKMNHLKSM